MKAVCAKCGEFKESAWVVCQSCNFKPSTDEEKAQFLLLSTHFNNEKKLKKFSEHIKAGNIIDFREQDLLMVTQVLQQKSNSIKEQKKHILKLTGSFLLTIVFMVIFYYYQRSHR
ncbi:MAG: hypothetical protein NE327_05700 [Lentisphaeraceae bacterium]|nr:hypothetical protein [Lentisphaeraceae bacterium]